MHKIKPSQRIEGHLSQFEQESDKWDIITRDEQALWFTGYTRAMQDLGHITKEKKEQYDSEAFSYLRLT